MILYNIRNSQQLRYKFRGEANSFCLCSMFILADYRPFVREKDNDGLFGQESQE